MIAKIVIPILLVLTFGMPGICGQPVIKIATDQAYWYPFTFVKNHRACGIHIDVVEKALTNLGYPVLFHPRPWKRALKETAAGIFDAVVSASYNPDRAQYLYYPADADRQKSDGRITQVEYVVITHAQDPFVFEGNVRLLPEPVRSLLGYSVTEELRAEGLRVMEAPDTMDCVAQLVESKRGSFVTPRENADKIEHAAAFAGKLRIHSLPLKSKSYYIAFSKKSRKLASGQMQAIWHEIARLREDRAWLASVFARYGK